eukprot:9538876-Prorocentrum_lima.AAC.1
MSIHSPSLPLAVISRVPMVAPYRTCHEQFEACAPCLAPALRIRDRLLNTWFTEPPASYWKDLPRSASVT